MAQGILLRSLDGVTEAVLKKRSSFDCDGRGREGELCVLSLVQVVLSLYIGDKPSLRFSDMSGPNPAEQPREIQ